MAIIKYTSEKGIKVATLGDEILATKIGKLFLKEMQSINALDDVLIYLWYFYNPKSPEHSIPMRARGQAMSIYCNMDVIEKAKKKQSFVQFAEIYKRSNYTSAQWALEELKDNYDEVKRMVAKMGFEKKVSVDVEIPYSFIGKDKEEHTGVYKKKVTIDVPIVKEKDDAMKSLMSIMKTEADMRKSIEDSGDIVISESEQFKTLVDQGILESIIDEKTR